MLSFATMGPAWNFRVLPSWMTAGGLLFLAGCALGGPERIDAVLSYPTAEQTHPIKAGQSSLVVETALHLDLNLGDPESGPGYLHTGYTVYDALGRKQFYVRNYIGQTDREATRIPLEPGKYLILLEKPGTVSPIFWVKIEENRLTQVFVKDLPKASVAEHP